MKFTRAIVRLPSSNFASGLSTSEGAPDLDRARAQHDRYVQTLRDCGLDVLCLPPDDEHPDATFVEDTAILTPHGAVITLPGAPSRAGEVRSIEAAILRFDAKPRRVVAPGTLDGGDVCDADGHFLIGLSARTNEHGAQQLQHHLGALGYTSALMDIRASPSLLHLKSGIAYLGDGLWVADAGIERLLRAQRRLPLRALVAVESEEAYAANCVRVNDSVLVPSGYPHTSAALELKGCELVQIEVSEFRKMDGGLSCLSLRA